jgi:hypothetical protein
MPDSFDMQQVDVFCDDLIARADTARAEQDLLIQLIARTAGTRPSQSRQYRALLEHTHERSRRFRELLARYCPLQPQER